MSASNLSQTDLQSDLNVINKSGMVYTVRFHQIDTQFTPLLSKLVYMYSDQLSNDICTYWNE